MHQNTLHAIVKASLLIQFFYHVVLKRCDNQVFRVNSVFFIAFCLLQFCPFTYLYPMNFNILDSILREKNVRLVAVSKTQPPERLLELYQAGQRIFGENRVQEMLEKRDALPDDIEWHLIGHLQTNKVKSIADFVSMIHSVDSLRLLAEIDKQAAKAHRTIDCLLQFHIAQEETKFGFDEAEAWSLLESPEFQQMKHIRVCGVMGMASFSEDTALVRSEFRYLHDVFQRIKTAFFSHAEYFHEISMGMSGDWEIAVEEGSTMVRIGSLLFGKR